MNWGSFEWRGRTKFLPNQLQRPYNISHRENRPELISVTHDYSFNFDQVYTEMSKKLRSRMIECILFSLSKADKSIQDRAVTIFDKINEEVGRRVAVGLADNAKEL